MPYYDKVQSHPTSHPFDPEIVQPFTNNDSKISCIAAIQKKKDNLLGTYNT